MQNYLCFIKGCRYPNTHVSRGHKCGKCGIYGHGIIECNDFLLRNELNKHYNDILKENDRCSYTNCKYNFLHKTQSHHCETCGLLGHNKLNCYKTIKCPICRTDNNIKFGQKKIYGSTDICSICLNNNVEIYLPNCGHCCICYNCFNNI